MERDRPEARGSITGHTWGEEGNNQMRQEGERGMEMTNYGFTGEQKVSYLREPINICIQTYILKPNVDRLGTEQNTKPQPQDQGETRTDKREQRKEGRKNRQRRKGGGGRWGRRRSISGTNVGGGLKKCH